MYKTEGCPAGAPDEMSFSDIFQYLVNATDSFLKNIPRLKICFLVT